MKIDLNIEPPAVVYFLKLSDDVVYIGECWTRRLFNRIDAPQTYFAEEISCLGVVLCESKEEARTLETELLKQFGPPLSSRKKCGLVTAKEVIREYIDAECSDAEVWIQASIEYNREKSRTRR